MMQFPSQFCSFLRRHRRKFIFAGVLVGGVVGSVKYAQYKVKDWMSQEEMKYLEEIKKQQHFEKTQIHCFAIAEAVVKALKEDIVALIDAEAITNSLKVEENPETKLKLWCELKISVFAKVASCLCILTLSVAITRVQLNHLAAKVYSLSSQKRGNNIDDATQRWFLVLSHEFIKINGLEYLVGEIKKISGGLTESMPLQCRVQGADIESVMKSTLDRIKRHTRLQFCAKDNNAQLSILDFLVPSKSDDFGVKNVLVNEMWDILDSDDCMHVFESCILKSFCEFCNTLDNTIAHTVGATSIALQTELILINSRTESNFLPLAKLVPILNAHVDTITSESFIRKILANDALTKFSANIYESFTNS